MISNHALSLSQDILRKAMTLIFHPPSFIAEVDESCLHLDDAEFFNEIRQMFGKDEKSKNLYLADLVEELFDSVQMFDVSKVVLVKRIAGEGKKSIWIVRLHDDLFAVINSLRTPPSLLLWEPTCDFPFALSKEDIYAIWVGRTSPS